MPSPDRTSKEITIQNDIITCTDDKGHNHSRCYLGPLIPSGIVSWTTIKYVKGADNGQGVHTMMIGVSKESHHVKKRFLGWLEKDWSMSLDAGYTFHN